MGSASDPLVLTTAAMPSSSAAIASVSRRMGSLTDSWDTDLRSWFAWLLISDANSASSSAWVFAMVRYGWRLRTETWAQAACLCASVSGLLPHPARQTTTTPSNSQAGCRVSGT